MSFALTSCVAAVPALLLCYCLVFYGFLTNTENMSVTLLGLTGFTWFLSSLVVILPFGIFFFGGPRRPKKLPTVIGPDGKEIGAATALVTSMAESSDDVAAAQASVADVEAYESMGDVDTLSSVAEVEAFDSMSEAQSFSSVADVEAFDSIAEMTEDEAPAENFDDNSDETTVFSAPLSNPEIVMMPDDDESGEPSDDFDLLDDEVVLDEDEDEPPRKNKKKR